MNKKILLLCFLLLSATAYAQVNIYEPFSGTGSLNANPNWTTHSGTAGQIQFLTTASDVGNSLSYPQLALPQGNRVRIVQGNSEDVNRGFTAVTSGTLYYSALIKILDTLGLPASSDDFGDYFLHFGTTSGSSVTTFFARLHIRKGSSGNTVQIGVANRGAASSVQPTFSTNNLAVNQTHFVVVKYDFASGAASLWVNPTTNFGAATEAGGALTNTVGTTSISQAASICIRQGTRTGNIEIDEIRVGQTWASVTPAVAIPLPIPTKLAVVSISPASPVAGQPFSVTVQAQDASNQPANVVAATGISLSATGSTIGGTTTGTIPAGQSSVTISGVTLSPAATGVTITATRTSGDNLTAGTSAPFNVQSSSPVATKLAVVSISPASPIAGQPLSVTVQAQDASNQPANVAAATGISLSATGSTIGGTTTGTIPAGQSSVTISGVTLSPAATGVTITATRTSGDNLTAGTSAPFTVQSSTPVATKLAVVSISPASPVAGQPFSVTVQAQDASNQPANVVAATGISLSATGSTIGGTTTGTIPAGQSSVTISGVTLSPAATGVTITATRTSGDNLTAGTSAPFTVQAGFSPIYEPFSGTGNLSANPNWTTHSGTAGQIQFLTTASDVGNSLSYPQLTSPQGNRVRIVRNNSEDVNRGFTAVTSGTLYYSALIKILDTLGLPASGDNFGDYFLHFGTTSGSSVSTFFARLHIRKGSSGNTVQIGVANRGAASSVQPTFSTNNLAVNQTHFVVVKYDIGSGAASLWVNPTTNFGAATEAGGALTNTAGTTSISQAASICIRQGTSTGNIEIDEIRVGQTWASVTPAPAPATQLFFASVPSAGTATVPLSPPIVVQARRADNSVATNFTGTITLSRATGPGTIGGIVSKAAVNGVATFDSVTLSQAGTYTLTASAPGLSSATTGNITILARASQLAFVNLPTTGIVGRFLPAFRVQARRPDNSVDTSFRGVITIGRLQSVSFPDDEAELLNVQTLSGVLSKAAVRGEALFDSVRVDVAGQITLTASATGLPTATSAAISIAAPPATRLRFVNAPTSARQNVVIPTFFVDALRADNTRDSAFVGNITVSLIGTGAIVGNTTRAAVFGRATFDSLRINAAGNFRLVATSGTLTADTTASFGVLNIEREQTIDLPRDFALQQNYPNPFNPSTVIVYELPTVSDVVLTVYDMLGREIATLVRQRQAAGRYRATFNAQNLSSGVYLYRLQAGSFVQTKKMMLLK
jgi:hypothetical protein